MKITLNTLDSRTTLTVAIYYCATILVVIAPTVLCANYDEAIIGNNIHPYHEPHHHHHHQHHHHQHHHQFPDNTYLRDVPPSATDALYWSGGPQQFHDIHHQHHHRLQQLHPNQNNLEDDFLKESAKDPKNLKNGIYHHGAMTYDLGMPGYEILNPHDPPEIITSDQPNYNEHMKHLQQSKNYTLQDFGVTNDGLAFPIEMNTTTESPTTETLQPDTTTTATTVRHNLTTVSPKNLILMHRDIEKELSRTKKKIDKLTDRIKITAEENKATKAHARGENVKFVILRRKDASRRKMKPAPFRPATPRPEHNEQEKYEPETPYIRSKTKTLKSAQTMQLPKPMAPTKLFIGGPLRDPHAINANAPSYAAPLKYQSRNDNFYDIPNASALHLPNPTTVPQMPYDDSSSLMALQKYPAPHQPFPALQNPYSVVQYNVPETSATMNLNTLHRLYRSASFLTNPENKIKSPPGST